MSDVKFTLRNCFAIPVRVVVLGPLMAVYIAGLGCEWLGQAIGPYLPRVDLKS